MALVSIIIQLDREGGQGGARSGGEGEVGAVGAEDVGNQHQAESAVRSLGGEEGCE